MKDSVDVIIPTYNGLPYLKETLKSVLGQTHKNLKVYIIDDGSTDKGATKKYVASINDSRVKYFQKSNGGQATARNYGIEVSNSDYVTFLDSDDIWYPEKLSKQLALFKRNTKLGLAYGLADFINENGKVIGQCVYSKSGRLFDYLLSGNRITGSASMVMIPRKVINKIGKFREDFLIGEDWEMWLRIAEKYEMDFVPDFIAANRVHATSMQTDQTKMADGLVYMLPVMIKEFGLNRQQQARLAETCLGDAIGGYMGAKNRRKARSALLKLARYEPLNVAHPQNWIGIGLYTRILFGNPVYTKAKRTVKEILKRPLNNG